MADNTTIEWTDRTWNPILGCDRVSPGCDNCYAIIQSTIRAGNPNPKVKAAFEGLVERRDGRQDWTGRVNLLPERLHQPLGVRKPQRWFVNSLADMFHAEVPMEYIAKVFAIMLACPHHMFQVLTKRHGRMRAVLSSREFWLAVAVELGELWKCEPPAPLRGVPPWIHIGVSVENDQWARIRTDALRATPAAVRWVSAEPLLGPVGDDSTDWLAGIDWVVAGGESGSGARPMHPAWVRSLRDQCAAAGVAFLFKQWGEFRPADVFDAPGFVGGRAFVYPGGGIGSPAIREVGPSGTMRTATPRLMKPGEATKGFVMLDADTIAVRMGKGKAGRELDGVVHDGYPPDWRDKIPTIPPLPDVAEPTAGDLWIAAQVSHG